MTSPLVSVCIPAFNAEKYLSAALDSILNQTYANIEIIVVDDGSKDETRTILNSYKEKGVKVILQENKGQCTAANAAFNNSSGDYIKFFDADDLLAPTTVQSQVHLALENPGCVISGRWGRFYNNDPTTFKLNPEKCWKTLESLEWIKYSWENAQPMLQCGIFLIPRSIMKKGGWDERLSLINDFEFFTRLILHSPKIIFSEEATLYYRSGVSGSLSGSKSQKAVESAILSVQLATGYLLKRENSVQTRTLSANCLQTLVFEFYHLYPTLIKPLENDIKRLGGSTLRIEGGKLLTATSKILGWKKAIGLKKLFSL